MTALYTSLQNRIQELIVGLALDEIEDSSIVVAKLPWARDMVVPGVRIAPEQDRNIPWTNEAYKTDLGVWVVYARVSNQNITGSLDVPNTWREAITAQFQAKDIVDQLGIQRIYNCRVESGVVLWEKGFAAQHDVGSLRIIATATRPR